MIQIRYTHESLNQEVPATKTHKGFNKMSWLNRFAHSSCKMALRSIAFTQGLDILPLLSWDGVRQLLSRSDSYVTVWRRLVLNCRRRLLLLLYCWRCLRDTRWQHVWQRRVVVRVWEYVTSIIRRHVIVERQDTAVTKICHSIIQQNDTNISTTHKSLTVPQLTNNIIQYHNKMCTILSLLLVFVNPFTANPVKALHFAIQV